MTAPKVPRVGEPEGSANATEGPRRRKRGGTVHHDDSQPRLPVVRPAHVPQRSPNAAPDAPPSLPIVQDQDARFGAAAQVYEALLAACPADERLLADLEACGVAPSLAKAEGFGGLYRGEHQNAVISALRSELGDEALLATPGFVASPGGSPRLDLPLPPPVDRDDVSQHEGAPDEPAPFALIPYRAQAAPGGRGPILAIEAFDLATRRSSGSVLLGCAPDGRDPRAGAANHLWVPGGEPGAVQAVTDGLIEALRATSAGIRCAAIRSPRSFDPGAGNPSLPELAGVDFRGRRVLYAPGPKRSHARTSKQAAASLLARAGATAFVLSRVPYAGSEAGFGTFLLSLPAPERAGTFARLFLDPVSIQLADEPPAKTTSGPSPGASVPEPQAPAPHQDPVVANAASRESGPEAPAKEDPLAAGRQRLSALDAKRLAPFRAELGASPGMPERGPRPTARDRSWGNQVAALLGTSIFAAGLLVLTVLSGVFDFFAASQRAMGPLTGKPQADEPLLLLPWFFATVFDEIGTPMGRFAELLSPGPVAALVALAPALVVALPLALTVVDIKRRQRIKRIKLHQGRFFE